jgi:hypothetical protein
MKLLPLAAEPFTAPTDRDMLPSERREFVRTHRTCAYGYARRADGPAMSIVYYVPTDTDELLVSTMRGRAKAKAVLRDEKVSLCILDERWPFAYLQVYCDARLGTPLDEKARPFVEAMAKEEDRVVIRCRPYETFAQPPRHLHSNDQEEEITHWITARMPWDAADEESISQEANGWRR